MVDSDVHLFLHPSGHHQIVYAKFNLKIHFPGLKNEEYGITDKGTLNLLEEQFMSLIGR